MSSESMRTNRFGDEIAPKEVNFVHQQAIGVETILKEERHQKLYTNFSINPFKKMEALTGKPNSFDDSGDGEEDTTFKDVIARASQVPTRKFLSPQTEAQEIGWITQPLVDSDRNDHRLFHPSVLSEMTRFANAVASLGQADK